MNVRSLAAALLLTTMTASGVIAADRPTVRVATVTKEIGAWCLETGFIYQPGFVAGNQPPPADFETVLLSTSQAVIATESGELPLDDCMGLGTLVQAWKQGARHVAIVAVTGIEPSYWLLGSKNVKKLADLRGKTLASNGPQTTATQSVIAMLQRGAHLAPDRDYTFVAAGNAGARAAALAAGKIDGIAAAQPYVYNMIDEGYPVLAVERQYVPNYVLGTLAVNRDWAEKNRPLLVSILKTMLQLGHWLKQPANKDAAIAKMAANVTEGTNTIGADYARRLYADTVAVNGGVVDGAFADRKLFASTLDLLAERGLITRADYPPLDGLVDWRYLNEARRQLGLPEVKW
jgi:ABC-type nitrate/sulfonate/bicarbonate transport system substrate-binding protein